MRILAKQSFKKDWFTRDEFNLVVDLLVKTQGPAGLDGTVLETIDK